MSPRLIRTTFTIGAAVVLLISAINFVDLMFFKAQSNDQCVWQPIENRQSGLVITDVVPGGVADQAGIKDGDILLSIDGVEVSPGTNAMALINRLRAGDQATYAIERGGQRFETDVLILKVVNIQLLSLFLLGWGFLVVGYIVVMTRPQGEVQRMFARYSLLACLAFGTLNPSINPAQDSFWKIALLGSGAIVGRVFGMPIFLRFFFTFPVRKPILETRWITPTLYVLSSLTAALLVFNNALQVPNQMVLASAFAPLVLYFGGLVTFAHSYFAQVEIVRRPPLRPILISSVIGIAAAAYLLIISASQPLAIFIRPKILLPGLLIVSVPLAFGYSIFRYRLMDIGILLKKSLTYGVITAAVAAIYVLIVFGFGKVLADYLDIANELWLNIGALLIIAFALDPIKQRVQEAIDRLFYRERYDYQKTLLEFSRELPRQMDVEQILRSVVNRISTTMHVEKVAVVLCDEVAGCANVSKDIPEHCCSFEPNHDGLMSLLRSTGRPVSFPLLAEEPESVEINIADKQKLLEAGIVLAVPMFLKDRLIGTINVGEKLSGKLYSREDVDLLSTVAGQAAVAIENARLHYSEIEKQKIEEEFAIARNIQQGLLPKSNPTMAGLDIAGMSLPARMVGGDYFDFIQLAPNRLLVVVADVSGKGMPAALYMSKIQGMVQLAAHMYASPKEILIQVNRRLYDGIERKSFVTMIVGLFDLEHRQVTICRAGHTKALLSSNGDVRFLEGAGIGLGLERGPIFEDQLEEIVLPLKTDDAFIFYTDGVTEAMNHKKAEFGEELLREMVRAHRHVTATELLHALHREVEKFRDTAEQNDDMTLVIIKTAA